MTNFAVIGTNFITDKFLLAARLCDDFCLKGVYSRTEERAKAYAAAQGAEYIYTDLDTLAKDPNIDAVYIASPTSCHAAQAIRMMEGGKHVLCEKPAASNGDELQQMLCVAKANGVVFLEAMRPVHNPSCKLIEELLPQIGQLRRVSFSYCQYSSRYDHFKQGIVENAFRPELSNGALMDIGSYCVHMAAFLFGLPEKITAMSLPLPNSIDGEGTALLHYGDFLMDLQYSKITNSYRPSEIQGEKGSILIDRMGVPDTITLCLNGEEAKTFDVSAQMDMRFELQHFLHAIQTGADITQYQQGSLDAMTILDEIRKSCGIHFPADDRDSGCCCFCK